MTLVRWCRLLRGVGGDRHLKLRVFFILECEITHGLRHSEVTATPSCSKIIVRLLVNIGPTQLVCLVIVHTLENVRVMNEKVQNTHTSAESRLTCNRSLLCLSCDDVYENHTCYKGRKDRPWWYSVSSLFFVLLYLLTYFIPTGSFDTNTGSVRIQLLF